LYSLGRDRQIARVGDREIPRLLEQGLKEGVDYFSEFLDIAQFEIPGYQKAFRDFLLLKYQGHRFDVILAMSPGVVPFLDENRNELFPESPVVFFAAAPPVHQPANS